MVLYPLIGDTLLQRDRKTKGYRKDDLKEKRKMVFNYA
jgi:hypothetical protein